MTEAARWYEARRPGLGHEFLRCVDVVFSSILRAPHRYASVHRGARRALTRRFPYQVLFTEDDERVIVLAVFHARRDPQRWQKRT